TQVNPTGLVESGRYSWRVRAIDAQDVAGQWSSARWFALEGPSRPRLSEPLDQSTTADSTPLFAWEAVPGATGYQIQIGPNRLFQSAGITPTSGTSYTSPALADGAAFWRVRAVNAAGIAGPWSLTWLVTIDTDGPPAPRLTAPKDAAGLNDSTPRFAWGRAAGAVEY